MTKTARTEGHRRAANRTSLTLHAVPTAIRPPRADCSDRHPVAESSHFRAGFVSTSLMPIHDPATLEKFRQAATACRTGRNGQWAKSRSTSGSAVTGNGGVGRCAASGQESASLVVLSPPPFNRQASSPTSAETWFSLPAVEGENFAAAVDDDETGEERERLRRSRGSRRRTMAVVTTARWIHQLLPTKTGASTSRPSDRPPPMPLPPQPSFALTSDDESGTSDAETNLLRRGSDRRQHSVALDLREQPPSSVNDGGDYRRSLDAFYPSTTTDRFCVFSSVLVHQKTVVTRHG